MYGYGYAYLNTPQRNGLIGRYEAGVRSDGGSFAFPIDTGLASRLEGLGLLNASSLANSCNAGKESVLYNLIPTPVSALDRFTVTRSTTKWVLGSNGVLTEIAANFPAFEYNTDGTYRGLLVEPAATNLLLRSAEFDNATWAKTASTISANATTSPDNASNGDKLVEDSTTASHIVSQSFTPINATTYTASAFIKASERGFAFLGFSGGSMATTFISVNLSTGAVSTATGTPVASSTQNFGNGWYRVSITLTSTGTVGSNVEIRTSVDGIWANRSYLGNGTSGIFIWGAQLETGSVATSYIPTTASTANRTADSVTLTGASSLIGQTEGYIAGAFTTGGATGALKNILSVAVDINNAIVVRLDATNQLQGLILSGGVTQAFFQSSALVAGTRYGFVLSYSAGATLLSLNGSQVGTTDTSATIPANTTVSVGQNASGTAQSNSHHRAIVLGSTVLSLASANALSSSLSQA